MEEVLTDLELKFTLNKRCVEKEPWKISEQASENEQRMSDFAFYTTTTDKKIPLISKMQFLYFITKNFRKYILTNAI